MSGVPTSLAAFGVWGSGTGVGKTLVSAGVFAAARRAKLPARFLKPVQTGFPADSDGALVARLASVGHTLGAHAATAAGITDPAPCTDPTAARTLYAWKDPVSPHLAVEREGRAVADAEVADATRAELANFGAAVLGSGADGSPAPIVRGACGLALVETAGGPASPGPSGSLQADVLRPLRLPAILVGDGGLGGISSSVCAYESLLLRGYDTPVLALLDGGLANHDAIARSVDARATRVLTLPPLRKPGGREASPAEVGAWLESSAAQFDAILDALLAWHEGRTAALASAPADARRMLWWPFTQHGLVSDETVGVIDSRCGEDLTVLRRRPGGGTELTTAFDACASWWTQGVSAPLTPALSRAIAYASGRWGHVMYPSNAHDAALQNARRLLDTAGSGWASRVFYSDDGSTAMEVALKMAFRAFYASKGLLDLADADLPPLAIVGANGSYHGDTLGTMNAQPLSVFSGPRQTPWHRPQGLFFDVPSVAMRGGEWTVELPASIPHPAPSSAGRWDTRAAALDVSARLRSELAATYRAHVRTTLDAHSSESGALLGALVLEPMVQGAGGMILVDPLFQRVLAEECRARSMPVVLDEVFVGLYRLGVPSTAAMLGITPDVAAYAKLLTGGTVPLSATLATERVFEAFAGQSKTHALLHGHSYSAHAIGCQVSSATLDIYADPATNPNLAPGGGRLVELWDDELVRRISRLPSVARTVHLGTLFAAEVVSAEAGWASGATHELLGRLSARGIQARPLGNVVYFMCTPTTPPSECTRLLEVLLAELERA